MVLYALVVAWGAFEKDLKTGLWTSWSSTGRIVEYCIFSASAPPNCGP